ncbi:NAD(P)H-binding protein [Psychrobacter sp. NG27]|uniref:NAD(P)H-binding protein n=1 Tax=Psychrobacter sp. NG27 TaxID=2781966 RepID=UPI0018E00F34|nr:NAD(P)H-binding protein [Psychrobacter sp. NG27]
MKIAVTAANGKLGSAIIESLIKTHPVNNIIALARSPIKAQFLIEQYGVEVRAGDYDDARQLEVSLQGVDAVLLVSSMDEPDKRIGQHRNVIASAKKSGVTKIVYTSIQGSSTQAAFAPIVQSNLQTEQDIKDSGLDWVIGRNGIYIEPDVDYIDSYKAQGVIVNCAGEGRCGYTTHKELAIAYGQMLTDATHHANIYNLNGNPITQQQLTQYLNEAFDTALTYRSMTVDAYRQDRINELGQFMGTVVAGIYEQISIGAMDNDSDFAKAAGREHIGWADYFDQLKNSKLTDQ